MNTKKNKSARKSLEEAGVAPISFGMLLKNHRQCENLTLAELSKILKISM